MNIYVKQCRILKDTYLSKNEVMTDWIPEEDALKLLRTKYTNVPASDSGQGWSTTDWIYYKIKERYIKTNVLEDIKAEILNYEDFDAMDRQAIKVAFGIIDNHISEIVNNKGKNK